MEPSQIRNLERSLKSYAGDISALYCVVTALLQQLKESQGEIAVQGAYEKAIAIASASRPINTAAPNKDQVRRVFEQGLL